MLKEHDRVRVTGDRRIGEIVNIIDQTIIVKYPGGDKRKVTGTEITRVTEDEIRITPSTFDEAVKAVMYETAEDAGETDQLDFMLELIAAVGSKLKARLFNEQG